MSNPLPTSSASPSVTASSEKGSDGFITSTRRDSQVRLPHRNPFGHQTAGSASRARRPEQGNQPPRVAKLSRALADHSGHSFLKLLAPPGKLLTTFRRRCTSARQKQPHIEHRFARRPHRVCPPDNRVNIAFQVRCDPNP